MHQPTIADAHPHDHTPKYCPRCGRELEHGTAVLVSGMIPGVAYRCTSCRVLYTPDLEPLARIVG